MLNLQIILNVNFGQGIAVLKLNDRIIYCYAIINFKKDVKVIANNLNFGKYIENIINEKINIIKNQKNKILLMDKLIDKDFKQHNFDLLNNNANNENYASFCFKDNALLNYPYYLKLKDNEVNIFDNKNKDYFVENKIKYNKNKFKFLDYLK